MVEQYADRLYCERQLCPHNRGVIADEIDELIDVSADENEGVLGRVSNVIRTRGWSLDEEETAQRHEATDIEHVLMIPSGYIISTDTSDIVYGTREGVYFVNDSPLFTDNALERLVQFKSGTPEEVQNRINALVT